MLLTCFVLSEVLGIKVVSKPDIYLGASLDFSGEKGICLTQLFKRSLLNYKPGSPHLLGLREGVFWLNIPVLPSLFTCYLPFGLRLTLLIKSIGLSEILCREEVQGMIFIGRRGLLFVSQRVWGIGVQRLEVV